MKENRKTQMTKKIFHECFIELLEEKSVDKITVSELCKKTDFNRSTFYTHYEDISFLIKEIEQGFVNHVPFSTMLNSPYDATYINIKYIYDNLKTFQLLINKQELVDTYIEKSSESLKKQNIKFDNSYVLALNYMIGGFIKAVEFWSYHQDECTIEQLTHRLSNFGNTISHITLNIHDK